jgi:hypothetical protein
MDLASIGLFVVYLFSFLMFVEVINLQYSTSTKIKVLDILKEDKIIKKQMHDEESFHEDIEFTIRRLM